MTDKTKSRLKNFRKNKEMWLNLIILNLSIIQVSSGFLIADPKHFMFFTMICNIININCRFFNNEDTKKYIREPDIYNPKERIKD